MSHICFLVENRPALSLALDRCLNRAVSKDGRPRFITFVYISAVLAFNDWMKLIILICIFTLSTAGCASKEQVAMNSKQDLHSISEFKKMLSPQLTASKTREIFGPPDSDRGSGFYRYQYSVKEGGFIILSFDSLLRQAIYYSAEGEELLF